MRRTTASLLILLVVVSFGIPPAMGAGRRQELVGAAPQPMGAGVDRFFLENYLGSSATAVVVRGNYAYVGFGYELAVLDVADPAHLRRLGYTLLPGPVRQIVLDGGYAYVAAGEGGLRVLSLARPTIPIEIGSLITPGKAVDVTIAGRYAYIAAGEGGLRIADISDPTTPIEVGHYSLPDAARGEVTRAAIAGSYAYIAASLLGLRVVNIANPARPVEVYGDSVPQFTYFETFDVAVVGHYAYVGDASEDAGSYSFGHLRIVDITDPAHPAKIGDYSLGGGEEVRLVIAGHFAYVSQESVFKYAPPCAMPFAEMTVVDISNPVSPTRVGNYAPHQPIERMAAMGRYLYLAAGAAGLEVVDVGDPNTPALNRFGSYPAALPGAVAAAGRYVFLGGSNVFHIVDTADAASPAIVGELVLRLSDDCQSGISDLAIAGDYAYIAARNDGLRIVDVANTAALTEVASLEAVSPAFQVAVAGTYAYVAAGSGLKIVSIANPRAPVVVGAFDTAAPAISVAVAGRYAFVETDRQSPKLIIVDVADPAHPQAISSYPMPGVPANIGLDIAVAGDYAYLATGPSGLRVVDISDPASPSEVGFFDTPDWATGVVVDGNRAYISDRNGELLALDITNSAALVQIDSFNMPNGATVVAAMGGKIYTNNGGGGLAILRLLNMPNRIYLPIVSRKMVQ